LINPSSTNGWENFRGIYNRSSQNNKNQGTEKTYNNNYSGQVTLQEVEIIHTEIIQRKIAAEVSNVSTSKTY
jgi:hypothetical protein